MINVVPISKAAPGWRPSAFQAPAIQPRPRLAQAVTTGPTTPPGGVVVIREERPAQAPFLDSALVSAIMSGLGAAAFFKLSRIFKDAERPVGSLALMVVSGLFAIKTVFWDIPNVREK